MKGITAGFKLKTLSEGNSDHKPIELTLSNYETSRNVITLRRTYGRRYKEMITESIRTVQTLNGPQVIDDAVELLETTILDA